MSARRDGRDVGPIQGVKQPCEQRPWQLRSESRTRANRLDAETAAESRKWNYSCSPAGFDRYCYMLTDSATHFHGCNYQLAFTSLFRHSYQLEWRTRDHVNKTVRFRRVQPSQRNLRQPSFLLRQTYVCVTYDTIRCSRLICTQNLTRWPA